MFVVNMEKANVKYKSLATIGCAKYMKMGWTSRFWLFILLLILTVLASTATAPFLQQEPEYIRPDLTLLQEIAGYCFIIEVGLIYVFSLCAAYCKGRKNDD